MIWKEVYHNFYPIILPLTNNATWPNFLLYYIYLFDLPSKIVELSEDPIIHEDYEKPSPFNNDIALLKLVEEVDVKLYTPICLPSVDADYTGRKAQVYGEISLEIDEDDLSFT